MKNHVLFSCFVDHVLTRTFTRNESFNKTCLKMTRLLEKEQLFDLILQMKEDLKRSFRK